MPLLMRIKTYLFQQGWLPSTRMRWSAFSLATMLFVLSRWLTWLFAVGVVVVSNQTPLLSTTTSTWLLILTATINTGVTLLARPVLRLAQRFPTLLVLDMLVCSAVLAASGTHMLPFFPYALSSLVLPTLLFSWQGGLTATALFIVFDQIGINVTGSIATVAPDGLILRMVLPVVAVFLLLQVRRRIPPVNDPTTPTSVAEYHSFNPAGMRNLTTRAASWDTMLSQDTLRTRKAIAVNLLGGDEQVLPTTLLTHTHIVASQESDGMRQRLFRCNPGAQSELSVALADLVEQFAQHSTVSVQLEQRGTPQHIQPASSSILFRLAQESLLNVHRHAHARSAKLTLCYEPQAVALSIQDDGVGLLDGTHERPGFHALRVLHYRLAEIGGSLQIEGEHDGCTVRGVVPLFGRK